MNVALGLMLRKSGKRESVHTAEDLWLKILSIAPTVVNLSKKYFVINHNERQEFDLTAFNISL